MPIVIAFHKIGKMERAARKAGNDKLANALRRERQSGLSDIFFG